MRYFGFFFSVLVFVVIAASALSGCSSSEESAETDIRTEIHYSSGGGVSGMSSGFSILHDGTVTRWSGRAGSINDASILGRLDTEEHAALLAAVQREDLTALRQQETGNMTTALRIVRDDVEYVFTWPGLHLRDEDVPAAVKPLRDTIWRSIQRLRSPEP